VTSDLPPPAPPAAVAVAAPATDLDTAQALILAGRFDEARSVLNALEAADPRAPQVQFLLGMLDRQDQDYDGAIRRFRRILVDEPKAERVRLELGRTFFEAGDYVSAERQFRYARAGDLPPAVVGNVDRYLNAIRQRKTVSLAVSFAISSDSNLNAGPATDTVTLYGLPFELSQNARATSGVGLVGDVAAEWAPLVAPQTKLRLGTQIRRAEYDGANFDDMTVAVYVGPRLNRNRWEFNVMANGARRWYGDSVYTDQWGGSADATWYATPRLGLTTAINLSRVEYARNADQTGVAAVVGISGAYTPTPASFVRGAIQYGRYDARADAYANHSWLAGVQYVREFRGGVTIGVTPSVTHIAYDAPLTAFNATRRDNQYMGQVSVLNRRLDLYGLTPKLVYTYIRNDSTIPLFAFSRSKVEVAVTSSF